MSTEPLRPLPFASSSFGMARLANRIYVVGGHVGREHHYPEEAFSQQACWLDATYLEWNRSAPRSTPMQGFALVPHSEKLYALGGLTYSSAGTSPYTCTSTDVVERYDPATDSWAALPPLPRKRSSFVAGVVNGKAYLMGGWSFDPMGGGPPQFVDEIDEFDLSSEKSVSTGVKLSALGLTPRRALAAVTDRGSIVLCGGITPGGKAGSSVSLSEVVRVVPGLSPRDWKAEQLPPLPYGVFAPGAAVSGTRLLVFGGDQDGDVTKYTDAIYSIDLDGRTGWRIAGRMVTRRSFVAGVALDSGSVALVGGHEEPTHHQNSEGDSFGWPSSEAERFFASCM